MPAGRPVSLAVCVRGASNYGAGRARAIEARAPCLPISRVQLEEDARWPIGDAGRPARAEHKRYRRSLAPKAS